MTPQIAINFCEPSENQKDQGSFKAPFPQGPLHVDGGGKRALSWLSVFIILQEVLSHIPLQVKELWSLNVMHSSVDCQKYFPEVRAEWLGDRTLVWHI
jgi:hypothetical protein